MSWIKKLFSKKVEKQYSINTINNNLSIKEQMKSDLIPRIWKMIEKEEQHFNWLKDNNADDDMVKNSEKYLNFYRKRYKEYNEYVAKID